MIFLFNWAEIACTFSVLWGNKEWKIRLNLLLHDSSSNIYRQSTCPFVYAMPLYNNQTLVKPLKLPHHISFICELIDIRIAIPSSTYIDIQRVRQDVKVLSNGIKYYAIVRHGNEEDGRFATILSSFLQLSLAPGLIQNNSSETTENSRHRNK